MGIRNSCLEGPKIHECGVCCLSNDQMEVSPLELKCAFSDSFHLPKIAGETGPRFRQSPTVEDKGKTWVHGIGIIEDSIVTHNSKDDIKEKTVAVKKKNGGKNVKGKINDLEKEKVLSQEDCEDRFYPMTPPRFSRVLESEKNNVTGSHAVPIGGLTGNVALQSIHTPPVMPELDAPIAQQAFAPVITVLDTRTIKTPNMKGLLLDQKPESIAGKYENEFGSYEVVGPFGIGRSASYQVWQENKDGSATTGRLLLTSTGEWEGDLENASMIFGQISIIKTATGLRSMFRGLNCAEWGDEMCSVKLP
eukprot:GEMP01038420.1.p1 GENE.GEMP01038420.1~~GEMP01038420.1.p1  ORF type:complete len:306 (+),score=59.66 GEMP01038420.1:45-962(+)